MFSRTWINQTVESMAFSGALSCIAAVALKGDPVKMAAVGALASLTHSCVSEILRRADIYPFSGGSVSDVTYAISHSLLAIGTLLLTQGVLRRAGGPGFDFAMSAIVMVGITLLSTHLSKPYNRVYLILA